MEASDASTPSRMPYSKLRLLECQFMKHELIELNITMYIPVAPDTFGCTPSAKRHGLNMQPPPIPSAPDTQPPKKLIVSNLIKLFPS